MTMKTEQKQRYHPAEEERAVQDLHLLNLLRRNDEEAFTALFRKYYEPLYRFVLRFVRDPQIGENLVQDVFVKLWETRESIRIRSNVRAYLYTAVRNHALNYLRREKIRKPGTKGAPTAAAFKKATKTAKKRRK